MRANKFATFAAVMALGLSALMLSAAPAIGANTQVVTPSGGGTGGTQCGVRRTTGIGGSKLFCKGESVDGAVITLNGGKTGYACHFRHAPRSGKVESGVIRYFPAEVQTPLCKNTLMSPGPRKEAGKDGRKFQKGDHVLGFAIEINVGPNGRTYFGCGMKSVPATGRVNSGVVNPSRFELKAITRCADTTDWRPGFRTESYDPSVHVDELSFQQGDYIVAAYIKYADGSVAGGGNACHTIAPQSGTLYGGVRNYWPGEDHGLPAC